MRLSALPLVLAGLLGSAALAPESAQAYPYGDQRYAYDSYGPFPGRTYDYPVAAEPGPYNPPSVRRCNRGTVLTGAAIGGGLGAMLASNSRNRLWSLPMGAAMGGILGGVISGC
jgi:hypothetical protein